MNKPEAETTKPQQQQEPAGDDEVFIGEIVNIYGKSGAGGDITQCRVLLEHNKRTITRSVAGPVEIGMKLSLRECVRESRRMR